MKRPKLKIRKRVLDGNDSPRKDQSHTCQNGLKLLIIAAIAIIPYIPSLNGDFVFDDSATIINNPIVTGKSELKQVCRGFSLFLQQFLQVDPLTANSQYHYHCE
ncbi:unnamed protein product [Strongylus vulgaris]|uniref:Uncharacterized protein n=1 Tax=Strongylus vulgaris TaxID=40348 RepID=A0A3P7JB45_STRVU|nr:unnamed protein product [Strongylus vulgaris]